jgi:hypothetical protein
MLTSSPGRLVEKGATVVLRHRAGVLREPDRETCADDTAAPIGRSPNSLTKICCLAKRVAAAMDDEAGPSLAIACSVQAGAAGLRRDYAGRENESVTPILDRGFPGMPLKPERPYLEWREAEIAR